MKYWIPTTVGVLAIALVSTASARAAEPSKEAVERARKHVRFLDDFYKTAVVLITEHYVDGTTDLPAGTAAKALFAAMKEKGWHETRLLDATGEPISDENLPQDEFERRAVKALLAGETYVDEVVTRDGKPYLRAATAVPVVMKKCVMCHDHYGDWPKGKAIGALGYTVPIE